MERPSTEAIRRHLDACIAAIEDAADKSDRPAVDEALYELYAIMHDLVSLEPGQFPTTLAELSGIHVLLSAGSRKRALEQLRRIRAQFERWRLP